ncbi:hypothetical protein CPB84DRAFT_1851734 [Gymnopilus junonius]|uniref:Uncharacterized protein n=1 Tax=Gymnopilus junonius TaxID=109634 RepID=A0A9P5NEI6_GYMJU|nr:hypothetical protein CPB84DRAFT_1851734 [Gymnopilus junonius]
MSKFLCKKVEVGASEEEEQAVRCIAATVYGAASDMTIAIAKLFFYLMAIHPDIQRKAQAEID